MPDSQSPQACKPVHTPTLVDNSLDEVESTAHYPGSTSVADNMSVAMPLLSMKDLAVATFRVEPAEPG